MSIPRIPALLLAGVGVLALIAALVVSAHREPVRVPETTLSVGVEEGRLYTQFAERSRITVEGKLVRIARNGVGNGLIGEREVDLAKDPTFRVTDHHIHQVFRLTLHASGDLIVTYQSQHRPPTGLGDRTIDSGTVIIPKDRLAVP